jgi:hypothetical protein
MVWEVADFSPPNFFLFPRLKLILKGRQFHAVWDIITNMTNELRAILKYPCNSASKRRKGDERIASLLKEISLKGINVIKL